MAKLGSEEGKLRLQGAYNTLEWVYTRVHGGARGDTLFSGHVVGKTSTMIANRLNVI